MNDTIIRDADSANETKCLVQGHKRTLIIALDYKMV